MAVLFYSSVVGSEVVIDSIWANKIVEQCVSSGIDHFFLAPGSRCTPLTLAVARRNDVAVTQHFDERGLAFAALGYGRATSKPGVFICTSGTAVANALPAVIESAIESVPLLLFTADRPTELHGTGANQTIDQLEIFGKYPNLFVNMPVPADCDSDDDPNGLTFLSHELTRGIQSSCNGPVHMNWMFREPFTIDDEASQFRPDVVSQYKHYAQASESLKAQIALRGNVVIAVGNCKPFSAQQTWELSQYLKCPILSDVTSGLRTGSLELPTEFSLPQPDTILHIGDRIVSKSWHKWMESLRDKNVNFIHLTSTGQTVNPNRLPVTQYQTKLVELTEKVTGSKTSAAFLNAWTEAAELRSTVVNQKLAETEELSEPALAFFISKHCPTSHGLFLGNSTPIRDMDWFGEGLPGKVRVVDANRGASGIDGLLATATGYAAGLKMPTTVLIGDLSALHDLNSLALTAKSKWPLIVIVVNNQRGHIFDLLPIRESRHFEQFFATPHEYQFEHAAKMFGLEYKRVSAMAELTTVYKEALSEGRSMILEVTTDRSLNIKVRQHIKEEIAKCSNRS